MPGIANRYTPGGVTPSELFERQLGGDWRRRRRGWLTLGYETGGTAEPMPKEEKDGGTTPTAPQRQQQPEFIASPASTNPTLPAPGGPEPTVTPGATREQYTSLNPQTQAFIAANPEVAPQPSIYRGMGPAGLAAPDGITSPAGGGLADFSDMGGDTPVGGGGDQLQIAASLPRGGTTGVIAPKKSAGPGWLFALGAAAAFYFLAR